MKNCYSYFKNEECEHCPCHKTSTEYFNCMFCCCPLFPLGDQCGGNFVYIEGGIKDCSACLIPHRAENYDKIMAKIGKVMELAKKP